MDLAIVIPCYNEEEVLPETIKRLSLLLNDLIGKGTISAASHVLFVDDGSCDKTWATIQNEAAENRQIKGLKLSRNKGHQTALIAGLFNAKGDCIISVDADLQDDLNAIDCMLHKFNQGFDIVYGVRNRRNSDTFFKRFTAESYYKLLGTLGVEIIFNHADYRLLSRRAVEALKEHEERNLFLRGIIPQLGFPSSIVHYDRAERFAGESKYPLKKMISFAWQGVSSFSAAPLRAITGIGIFISMGSFFVVLWALWIRLFTDTSIPGWASTVLPMYFLGGVQLLCTGIIGEYLAKIYLETKRRPHYFIEEHSVSYNSDRALQCNNEAHK